MEIDRRCLVVVVVAAPCARWLLNGVLVLELGPTHEFTKVEARREVESHLEENMFVHGVLCEFLSRSSLALQLVTKSRCFTCFNYEYPTRLYRPLISIVCRMEEAFIREKWVQRHSHSHLLGTEQFMNDAQLLHYPYSKPVAQSNSIQRQSRPKETSPDQRLA